MKKLLTICTCLLIGVTASAQLSSGSKIIKGSFGLNTVGSALDEEDYDAFSSSSLNFFTITPQFEYFISDRASIGLSAGYTNGWMASKRSSDFGDSKMKTGVGLYYVGPTYNYYFPLAKKFYLSLNCFVGYAGLTVRTVEKMGTEKNILTESGSAGLLTVTPTLNYFINDRWMMTASIGNVNAMCGKMKDDESTIYSAGIDWGQITLGVGFKF